MPIDVQSIVVAGRLTVESETVWPLTLGPMVAVLEGGVLGEGELFATPGARLHDPNEGVNILDSPRLKSLV